MTPEHRQWLAMLDDRIKTARDSVWAPPLKIKAALAEIDAHRAKLAADKHPVLTASSETSRRRTIVGRQTVVARSALT